MFEVSDFARLGGNEAIGRNSLLRHRNRECFDRLVASFVLQLEGTPVDPKSPARAGRPAFAALISGVFV